MAKLSQTVLDILGDHRDSIDRLDAILVYTLGERFRHTKLLENLKQKMNCHLPTLTERHIKFQDWKVLQMKQI